MLPTLTLILLVPFTTAKEPWFHLRILHVNDMHARFSGVGQKFEPCEKSSKCFGGFARVSQAANDLIAHDPHHTIFLNAGDNFQGSALYTQFKSDVVVDFLNEMKFDAMTLGNHEFDNGVPELNKFLRQVKHRNVCANLNLLNDSILTSGEVEFSEWVMMVKNHTRIGIVGYITPATQYSADAGNVQFSDVITSVRRASQRAIMNGAQIIIALGHAGHSTDMAVAKEVSEVDIVVGGHSHTFLFSGNPPDPDNVPEGPYPTIVTQPNGKAVPVIQAFKFTKYLGYFTIEFDESLKIINMHGNPILMSPELPEDPKIIDKLNIWMNELNNFLAVDEVVVKLSQGATRKGCKYEECGLGNLVADAIAAMTCQDKYPDIYCVAAVYNGGGIRSDIGEGVLTNFGLTEIYPFNNSLHLVEMEGKYVLEMLETSVRWYDVARLNPKGGFLQISGLNVEYDVHEPPGKRVHSAKIRFGETPQFRTIVPDQKYRIVVPEYIYRGGDNYTVFADRHLKSTILNITDFMATRSFLRQFGAYAPSIEKRIKFIDKTSNVTTSQNRQPASSGASFTQVTHLFCVVAVSISIHCFS